MVNYRYGFELEAFYSSKSSMHAKAGIEIPPKEYPVDGFPGLVEIRTVNHDDLYTSYYQLLKHIANEVDIEKLIFTPYHTFTAEEKRELRKRNAPPKKPVDIQNLYGKKPRSLGNKTIASFQINISNLTKYSFTDKNGVFHPEEFGLLDVGRIVRNLDKAFATQIKESGRQPGEYAIKGCRLEYRSLPNSVAPINLEDIPEFLQSIKKAVEDRN